jgi:hypothetical protein
VLEHNIITDWLRREAKMNLQKVFLTKFVILAFILLVFNSVFSQVKKEETIAFSGVIESISKDFRFVVVNEVRIFVSSGTTIVDGKGKILRTDDLKPKLNIAIEALRNPDGLFAKKIVVKTLGTKP